jgi:hypothetical protein
MSTPIISKPLTAKAVEGDVVLTIKDSGIQVAAALTPQAVLASIAPLREAAEQAIADTAANGASPLAELPASFEPLVRPRA